MRSVFVCVLLFFSFAGALLAQEKTVVETKKLRPALIKGTVVDQDDEPVESAKVNLLITTIDEDRNWKELLNQTISTDEKGEFQIELSKTPAKGAQMYLNLTVGSKVHFRRDFHFDDERLWTENVDLGSLKISRGVRVKGQLVSPDPGLEIQGPVVNFAAATGGSFYHSDSCDDEGRFACVVPAGCKLKLSIAAENFAFSDSVHEIEAIGTGDKDKDEMADLDLGQLKLRHGVSVVGTAKRVDGSPAAGIVIGIVEREFKDGYEDIGNVSSAKTDADGNFRLPPHLGSCRLYVLKSCRNRTVVNGETQPLESDGKVPFFTPVDIELDDKAPELNVELKEVESATISGTIYDAKGAPLVGQQIGIGWGSSGGDIGMEGAIEMDYIKTDDEGKYSFEFGTDRMLYLRLYDEDVSNNGLDFFMTKKASFVLGDFFTSGSSRAIDDLEFKPIDRNIEGLDFQVLPADSESSLLKRAIDWMLD